MATSSTSSTESEANASITIRPTKDLVKGPLNGVRILDFSRQLAGAAGTRILAAYGAEVLRAEWPDAPGFDFVRVAMPADGIPGVNRGGMFNAANLDKRSFTLNMATEEGRELAKDLVRQCDVVYENMTPRVMKNWGIDYESLREIKPDLVYVSCSGFGQTGPTSHYRSYGSPSQGHTGVTHLAGHPGFGPAGWGFQIGDPHAGVSNALTTLMGIYYHKRTGKGLFIDSAQTQNNILLSSQFLLGFLANGHDYTTDPDFEPGNKRLYPKIAPHNVYPCAGDDRWCAITVHTDDEWRSLVAAMGDPDWATGPDFATSEARWEAQEQIDKLIGDWTRTRDRRFIADLLQGRGVRAGVVQDSRDRLNWDAQLAHRGTYATVDHPEVGPRRYETVGAKLRRNPYVNPAAAPLLGQHNDYVFREVLGLDSDQIAGLEAKDVLRTLTDIEGIDHG